LVDLVIGFGIESNRKRSPRPNRQITKSTNQQMRIVLPFVLLAALVWWFGLQPLGEALAHVSGRGLAVYVLLTAVVVLGYALRCRLVARAVGG
jgi:hypothetical protein